MTVLNKIKYADDDVTPLRRLVMLRIPSLLIGLVLGMVLSFTTSEFEDLLVKNVHVAFFIPLIVYMSDAVGTQTQSIYTRDLVTGKASFKKYLIKETLLGVVIGVILSVLSGLLVLLWLKSTQMSLAVSLGMFGAVASAPIISMLVTEVLELEHTDPAVGAGPIATVIQDTVSILIFGGVATAILL